MSKYRLIESAWYLRPGQVAVWVYRCNDWHEVRRANGNCADDLMERYRSAPDEEHRQMILRAAVERGE